MSKAFDLARQTELQEERLSRSMKAHQLMNFIDHFKTNQIVKFLKKDDPRLAQWRADMVLAIKWLRNDYSKEAKKIIALIDRIQKK